MNACAATARPPLLVVVTGPPASGKTTLAQELARRLRVTVLSKDTFKETLYEVFGSAEEFEEKIDEAGVRLLTAAAEQQIKSCLPVIVESNFDRGSDSGLQLLLGLQADYEVRLVQLYCDVPDEEVVESFRERAESGRRHPGHGDQPADAAEVERALRAGTWDPLDLDAPLLRTRPEDVSRVLAWLAEI